MPTLPRPDVLLTRRLAGCALFAAIASACAGAPQQQAMTASSGTTGVAVSDIRARLYEAAKREGALTVWGPATDTVTKYFPEEFQKAFPGVTLTGVSDNQAPAKLVTEMRAGTFDADALWWPYTGALALDERGWLTTFTPDERAAFGIGDDGADMDGRALKVANFVYGLVYDTRALTSDAVPKTWEGLGDPRWRGRITGSTLLTPFLVAGLGLVNGEAWALDFARTLRRAEIALVPDSIMAIDMLMRGEKALMITTPGVVMERRARFHETIEWSAVSPTFATQHVAVVVNRGPHPNAAKLWALWAASAEGQAAMDRGAFEVSARPGAPTAQARLVAESGARVVFETLDMVKPRMALHNKVRPILFGEAP
ncbi:MAG: extracellular solute-binding protein [Vicinamibacterales bacterium]